ncbi:MAG: hypothetical protein GKR98_16660 [Boseongicola sp.]|nr:MAG: hypothetical protein GKR98_16660 [Boseongicola sp.]
MELAAHDSDPEIAKLIQRETLHFAKQGPSWCAFAVDQVQNVLDAIPVFKTAMVRFDSRQTQTYATLLAGLFVALNRHVPNDAEADELVQRYSPTLQTHHEEQQRDNAREALDHLLAHTIRGTEHLERPLGYWLEKELDRLRTAAKSNTIPDCEVIVEGMQICVRNHGENAGVALKNGAPPINQIFANTPWANGSWQRALGQFPGAFKPKNPMRFRRLSGKHRGLILPLSIISDEVRVHEGEF